MSKQTAEYILPHLTLYKDGRIWAGAQFLAALCNGAKTQTFSYSTAVTDRFEERTQQFWKCTEYFGRRMFSRWYYILVCRDNISLSDLSHEAFHLTSGAMRFIGCDLNEGSEEAYAYLHGFVFGEIAKKLNYKK